MSRHAVKDGTLWAAVVVRVTKQQGQTGPALGSRVGFLVNDRGRSDDPTAVSFVPGSRTLGIRQSAACRGPAENAHIESFWHSLKAEVLHGTGFATDEALRQTLARYIHYYNHRRLHSALGYRSPIDYEKCAA